MSLSAHQQFYEDERCILVKLHSLALAVIVVAVVVVRPRSLGTFRRKILYAKNCSALHSLLAITGSLLCFGRAQVDRFVLDGMRLTTLPFFLRMAARLLFTPYDHPPSTHRSSILTI